MDAPSRNSISPYTQINQDLDALEKAIRSMKPEDFKDTLPSWSGGEVKPRGWITLFDSGASYTANLEGLQDLVKRTNNILERLQAVELDEGKKRPLLERFTGLVQQIDSHTKPYMTAVIKNYQSRNTGKDPQKLKQMAEVANSLFTRIHNINNFLNGQPFQADPMHRSLSESTLHKVEVPLTSAEQAIQQAEVKLQDELIQLVSQYDRNKALLAQVVCSRTDALKVPADLVNFLWAEKASRGSIKNCLVELARLKKQEVQDIKPLIAQTNNLLENFNRCGELATPVGTNRWISLQVTRDPQGRLTVKEGSATPTSKRGDKDQLNDLTNIKVQVDTADSHITITCGVIDTQLKAEEFIKALEYAWSRQPRDSVPRIVLHQVNSKFSDPSGTIEKQHKASRYIEERIRESMKDKAYRENHHLIQTEAPIIVHMNAPLNKASAITFEESFSKELNLEGLTGRLIWFLDDFRRLKVGNELLLKNGDALVRLRNKVAAMKPSFEKAEVQTKEFTEAQTELRNALITFIGELVTVNKELTVDPRRLSEADQVRFISMKTQVEVLSRLLAAQLSVEKEFGFEVMGRTTELELHLLFDNLQGVQKEINCKSGLDRTGYLRSIADSMNQLEKDFILDNSAKGESPQLAKAHAVASLLSTVLNQNVLGADLDVIQEELVAEHNLQFVDTLKGFNERTPHNNFYTLLTNKIAAKTTGDPKKIQALLNAYYYQNLIVAHLLANAQVITNESSGVPGLKWGHDAAAHKKVAANPHPLVRLPMFIQTSDGLLLRLFDRNTNFAPHTWWQEMPHRMTDFGADGLCRLSGLRGD